METLDSYSDRGSNNPARTCLLLSERNLSFQEASFPLSFFQKKNNVAEAENKNANYICHGIWTREQLFAMM
jgi:hypothetical protein